MLSNLLTLNWFGSLDPANLANHIPQNIAIEQVFGSHPALAQKEHNSSNQNLLSFVLSLLVFVTCEAKMLPLHRESGVCLWDTFPEGRTEQFACGNGANASQILASEVAYSDPRTPLLKDTTKKVGLLVELIKYAPLKGPWLNFIPPQLHYMSIYHVSLFIHPLIN